ncbi:MAG: metallophosphoesterase family protein [Desulfobacterales bacterium]
MNEFTFHRLGIMADSHGNALMIEKAIAFLRRRRCDQIIHLGDICDSFQPDTCEACIRQLQGNGVWAVKGNNDHVLEINQTGNVNTPVSEDSLAFLRNLPPTRSAGEIIFAHSLPFFKELGISCITKVMGKNEIQKFFAQNTHTILFRGHSHAPAIKWKADTDIRSLDFPAGNQIHLGIRRPCIVTCGALTRGLVMIWEAGPQLLSSLSITSNTSK